MRVLEHMFSDKASHIFKHFQNSPRCRTSCSNNCFSILHHTPATFQLEITEVIYIQWEKRILNYQLYHVNLKFSS